EAQSDGWVMVNFLSTRPDEGLAPPPMRLMVEARDVTAWVSRARALLSPGGDSIRDPAERMLPSLGNGRYRVELQIPLDGRQNTHLAAFGCGPGSGGSSPPRREMAMFLTLLDSAANLAGGKDGRAPTLRRVYYAGEVSCPASPSNGNLVPRLPVASS